MKTTGISKKGILFLLLGIGLFSTVEICQKLINKNNAIDPNMMVFIRFVVTGVLLLAFGLPSYFSRGGRLTMRDWGVFAFNGFFGIALSLGFFHFGINMFRNASSSAVVFSANAVFAIVIARFMNKEEWNCRKWHDIAGLERRLPVHVQSGARLSRESCGVMVLPRLFALSVCFTKRVVSNMARWSVGGSSLIGGFLSLPLVF